MVFVSGVGSGGFSWTRNSRHRQLVVTFCSYFVANCIRIAQNRKEKRDFAFVGHLFLKSDFILPSDIFRVGSKIFLKQSV